MEGQLRLQGTILSIKKQNGDISPILAGKSVLLKAITERKTKRTTATLYERSLRDAAQVPRVLPKSEATKVPEALPEVQDIQVIDVANVPGFVETDGQTDCQTDSESEESTDKLEDKDRPRSRQQQFAERISSDGKTWEGSVMRILSILEPQSKFKQRAKRSRRRFFSNLFLSCRLALWMVILGGPVIVWPVAEFFNNWGERSSKYMASYGMAMSNFCFLLSPNMGMGIRYAIEGVLGTLLALANMMLLNQAGQFHTQRKPP